MAALDSSWEVRYSPDGPYRDSRQTTEMKKIVNHDLIVTSRNQTELVRFGTRLECRWSQSRKVRCLSPKDHPCPSLGQRVPPSFTLHQADRQALRIVVGYQIAPPSVLMPRSFSQVAVVS